jgi:hypothetical protein
VESRAKLAASKQYVCTSVVQTNGGATMVGRSSRSSPPKSSVLVHTLLSAFSILPYGWLIIFQWFLPTKSNHIINGFYALIFNETIMDSSPTMQVSLCMNIHTIGAHEGMLISTGIFSAGLPNTDLNIGNTRDCKKPICQQFDFSLNHSQMVLHFVNFCQLKSSQFN